MSNAVETALLRQYEGGQPQSFSNTSPQDQFSPHAIDNRKIGRWLKDQGVFRCASVVAAIRSGRHFKKSLERWVCDGPCKICRDDQNYSS